MEWYNHARARRQPDLRSQPLVRARMLQVIGRAYSRLGLHDTAIPYLRSALELRASSGADAVDLAETRNTLGTVLATQGHHEEAERLLRAALASRRQSLGDGHLLVAETESALADVRQAVGDQPDAEALFRHALVIRRAHLGDAHPEVADNVTDIAGVLLERGQLEEAERAYREALEIFGSTPAPAPGQYRVLGELGFLYLMSGRYAEAEAASRQSLGLVEARLGSTHWRVPQELTAMASAMRRQRRGAEAEVALRRALTITPRRPQDRAITLGALASVLRDRSDLAGAEASQREAVTILEQVYGPDDPVTVASRSKLVAILRDAGRGAEADRLAALAAEPDAGHAVSPAR